LHREEAPADIAAAADIAVGMAAGIAVGMVAGMAAEAAAAGIAVGMAAAAPGTAAGRRLLSFRMHNKIVLRHLIVLRNFYKSFPPPEANASISNPHKSY